MTPEIAIRALQRQHLFPFVWRAFGLLHPGQPFLPAWHVQAMCHRLEQVAADGPKRLVITVPPRHGKSICTAVCLPAWLLGHRPDRKIMVASYGGELAAKHARDFRTVLTSSWYRELFPSCRLAVGGNRADEQITTAHGGRKAVSLGGAATGFGADLIIVDDLMKAADASSPIERQRVRDYYEQTLVSRLNDKTDGRIVVIQQRLHEDDLPGYLLESGQFTHLDLPAIAKENEDVPIGLGRSQRRLKGEALCPEREPLETLNRLRLEIGPAAFSAQYQQDPTPPGGNRIRWEWFGTYDTAPGREAYQHVVQSWDTAMSAEPTCDFSVGMTWGYRDQHWHLLDVDRARLDFPDLKRRVRQLAQHWNADGILIESSGSGISLLQQLRQDEPRAWRFTPVLPTQDKQTRLEAQTARLEEGRYLLPATPTPWLAELRRELLAFPAGRYDDQVDSLVQFVAWSSQPRGQSVLHRNPITGRPLGGRSRHR